MATLVGDRERERTAGDLGLALTQGYLQLTEYEERLNRAFAAHTTDELCALTADLPTSRLRRHDPRRRAAQRRAARLGVQIHLGAYLAGSVLMLATWLIVGLTADQWYFWPVWPILGWGIGVASHIVPVTVRASNSPSFSTSAIDPGMPVLDRPRQL
ncbi:DUF1707 domain-containing protein [Mycolicibacterium fluoranthenivorans]|jgi:hypothetical protein|uniref:DUF1707 domain-containing protein n=1 Tax=Mycolicibacterium fluoranthenivorans TaxID=258505 RepID=A0A7G8PIZ4_9MYCO|nr:DUF1707 domain-containing protein [Mycolicibacterium fluoranthenivorans]QNJ94310.1 DUF1707 domain-containing protein [Mycolicibacterium fluoranthenivorans]